jgi:SulP family sulfate permease
VTGIGLSEAGDRGWLLGPFPEEGPGLSIVASQIIDAEWKIVIAQLPTVGTILIVSIIGLLLNASAIELTVRRDIDINRELRTAGLANILATPGGGMVGFHYLSLSALSHRMGGRTATVGLVTAAVFALTMIIGTCSNGWLPREIEFPNSNT